MKNNVTNIKQLLNTKSKRKKISRDEEAFVQHYLGTKKKYLGIKTGDVIYIAKKIVQELETKDKIKLLDELFGSDTFEEHAIGGKIFTLLKPEERKKIPFAKLEKWLSKTHGWVEVDVICQSSFTAPEVLERWKEWEQFIKRLSISKNIQLRRASLVLQTPSARKTEDKRVEKLAFETVEKLKSEKEVLITKAVSWLLRSLVAFNKEVVKKYLTENESALPRIAFRETIKKIETGKK